MAVLRLPSAVFDDSLGDFVTRLAHTARLDDGPVELDFQDVQFYVPGALAALLATVQGWARAKRPVSFLNCESCPAFTYLQRMDFFRLSGVALPENFVRRPAEGRFVPLCRIDGGTVGGVQEICTALARCVFAELADSDDPQTAGPFDMVEYATSELINNVIQHARGPGFVAAQVYPQSGLVRLAVADCGIGIRQSFAEFEPPFWDPAMSHLDAVRTALQPKVSSKTHLPSAWGGPVNAGVGLSMLKEIARHADGMFTLLSGTGFYQHNHLEPRRLPTELSLLEPYAGTVCALQLPKQRLGNLQEILHTSKQGLGLLQPDHRFDDLFR
jgi:signal transduction histidine kinase